MQKKARISSIDPADELVKRILSSRKYRGIDVPAAAVRDLLDKAAQAGASQKEIEKIVRQKLHNIVAPYLGDPDYPLVEQTMGTLPRDLHSPELHFFCLELLKTHASTAERVPMLSEFFKTLFAHTGQPHRVLDVACGLNPFSLPWMGLSADVEYFAYDLHLPRIQAINTFLSHVKQKGSAQHVDILVSPPAMEADVVFFFKEAHRFEQRQRGSCREFFKALNTRYLLVSLPTASLSGRHPKIDQDRRLMEESVHGQNWLVDEILFPNEIVFCIRKAA